MYVFIYFRVSHFVILTTMLLVCLIQLQCTLAMIMKVWEWGLGMGLHELKMLKEVAGVGVCFVLATCGLYLLAQAVSMEISEG